MSTDGYILRSVDIDRDAEKLAQMWNASDDQWPGTWTEGVPMTPQRVREWHERQQCIEERVWDTGHAIAGYCSLWELPEEENVTYIGTLNVAPAFQKKSLGRKFLTHYVERAVELGSVRLDLHTWPGNLKAMPLYKKCGFFWMPDTDVHMLNFMPAILAMPCAQSYFQKHDWYRAFKRELAQTEDDERWEGMKVFTYRFEEDDDSLTVWADRESRTITAVETGDFFAAAIASETVPPRGLPTTLRWKLTNKRNRPMQVSIVASGDQHLKLDHRAALQLAPGESVTLEAEVEVAADGPEVKKDKPAPAVKSVLVIDGQVLELATGFRPRTAIEVSTYPEYVTLLPGVAQTIQIQLRSHLKWDIEATMSVAPEKGLATDWTQQPVSLPAEGYGSLAVTLQTDAAGVFELPVSISLELDGEMLHLPPKLLAVFALPLGGVLGAQVGGKLRIENETLRLVMEREGGRVTIFDRVTGEKLARHGGYATPPTEPSEYYDGLFDLSLERHSDRVVAVASMTSRENPGFVLRKRISVNASPVFSIGYDFENLGAEERRFQLHQFMRLFIREEAMLTLPLKAGMGRGPAPEFPGVQDDEFKRADAYAEGWAALESRYPTLGIMWADDVEELWWGWHFSKLTRFYECLPQSRVRPGTLRIYVGDGDWRTVQRLWQRLASQPVVDSKPLREPSRPLTARTDPAVVVASDRAARATLLVENLISRKFNGTATLMMPEGWQADVTEFDLAEVNWQQPHRAELHLSTTAQPGAAIGRIAVRSAELDADFDLPLIRLGDGRAVVVRGSECAGQRVLTVDNGRLEIDVTPGFSATVSALREGGVNHLATPFPNVETFGWMSPWYGGLMPMLMLPDEDNFPGRLWQETFDAEAVSISGGQSIPWRGVRQRAALQHEDVRGLAVEIETLTVGGSPVVKQVMRLLNTTSVVRRLQAGWVAFVRPDGSRARTTLLGSDRQLKHSDRIIWFHTGHWVAAQNPDTGRAVALISPLPQAQMSGWGKDGGHLALLPHLMVPANGSAEVVAYIVLADDLESVKHFAALKDLT